jgi:hypothetical protein
MHHRPPVIQCSYASVEQLRSVRSFHPVYDVQGLARSLESRLGYRTRDCCSWRWSFEE